MTALTLPGPARAAACQNEALRTEQVAQHLPDCAAWEMVSPVDKNNGDVNSAKGNTQAAVDGQRVAFTSEGSFAGSGSSILNNQYFATRGPDGWSTKGIMPPQDPAVGTALVWNRSAFLKFSPDLRWSALISSGMPMAPGAQKAAHTVYVRDNDADQYTAISTAAPGGILGSLIYRPALVDASDDRRRIFYASNYPQTPEVPDDFTTRIYEWHEGAVRLASLTPTGEVPTSEVMAGASTEHGDLRETSEAVSADGSRLFFEMGGEVYLAEGGPSRMVSASQRSEPDPNGDLPAKFEAASEDGRYVYFSSAEKLTDDATTSPAGIGKDLYRYDVATEELADITIKTTSHPDETNGAEVEDVLGISRDGAYVYFIAHSHLVAGEGDPNNSNLYLWHEGDLSHINGAGVSWRNSDTRNFRTSQVTPDGRHIYFTSRSWGPSSPAEDEQVMVYDADADQAQCISCPDGPATADPANPRELPGPTYIGSTFIEPYSYLHNPGQFISADGSTAYFHTVEALVPEDVNGRLDVYRWRDGAVSLISSGRGAAAYFADSTPDGDIGFFVTANRLVGWDRDETQDLYAAWPGGGFPEPVDPPAACVADDCQGPPVNAPPDLALATAARSGPDSRCRSPQERAERVRAAARKLRKQARRADGGARKLRARAAAAEKRAERLESAARACKGEAK